MVEVDMVAAAAEEEDVDLAVEAVVEAVAVSAAAAEAVVDEVAVAVEATGSKIKALQSLSSL